MPLVERFSVLKTYGQCRSRSSSPCSSPVGNQAVTFLGGFLRRSGMAGGRWSTSTGASGFAPGPVARSPIPCSN